MITHIHHVISFLVASNCLLFAGASMSLFRGAKPDWRFNVVRVAAVVSGAFYTWHIWTAGTTIVFLLVAGLAILFISAAIFFWAAATTRHRRFALAFSGQPADQLVSHGPYRYVRHPFYLSYIMTYMAGVLAGPGAIGLTILTVMFSLYWYAATVEEDKFKNSSFASGYSSYRRRTGMFFPKLRGRE